VEAIAFGFVWPDYELDTDGLQWYGGDTGLFVEGRLAVPGTLLHAVHHRYFILQSLSTTSNTHETLLAGGESLSE